MSEKPFQKPDHGVILRFQDRASQSGPASEWVGTDLARFAQDVIALNSRNIETEALTKCQVAPLENMQKGLRIKKKEPVDESPKPEAPIELSRYRKE